MKLSIKDFFSKYDQIRSFLRICSQLWKKSWTGNFVFCAVSLEASKKYKKHFDVTKAERSRPEMFCRKSFLKQIVKFTGKHLWWCLFLVNLQSLQL